MAGMELSETYVRALVHLALEEDIGSGDITSNAVVDGAQAARAELWARSVQVVAGMAVFGWVYRELDPHVQFRAIVSDGVEVPANTLIAELYGPARSLLAGERVALNFVQRLSGIATLTRRFVRAMGSTHSRLLDTRKTTPLLRVLEKYAVQVGGGCNHRLGLDDAYLIKENHIRLAGGVARAFERAIADCGNPGAVEIEVTSEQELVEALQAGARWILLDNMAVEQVRRCVEINSARARLEVSGGIDLDNISAYAATGVDAISVGALTHSAPAANLSLLIVADLA